MKTTEELYNYILEELPQAILALTPNLYIDDDMGSYGYVVKGAEERNHSATICYFTPYWGFLMGDSNKDKNKIEPVIIGDIYKDKDDDQFYLPPINFRQDELVFNRVNDSHRFVKTVKAYAETNKELKKLGFTLKF